MSITKQTVYICDNCNDKKTYNEDTFGGARPYVYNLECTGGGVLRDSKQTKYNFCSLQCVGEHVHKQIELESVNKNQDTRVQDALDALKGNYRSDVSTDS